MVDNMPNQWSKGWWFGKLDLQNLKHGVQKVLSKQDEYFPRQIDAAIWEPIYRDGRRRQMVQPRELGTLLESVDSSAVAFYCRLYHDEEGLLPELFLDVTVDFQEKRFELTISTTGEKNAEAIALALTKNIGLIDVPLPPEHFHLEVPIRRLLADHPETGNNVFLIMRYSDHSALRSIVDAVKTSCETKGVSVLRADDRAYSDDLWDNVMTYMYACEAAIAVVEEINTREFNPNIAIEIGFMMAKCKPVLLLKDKAIQALPSDIAGKLYRPYDTYHVTETVPIQIEKWMCENNIGL